MQKWDEDKIVILFVQMAGKRPLSQLSALTQEKNIGKNSGEISPYTLGPKKV